MCVCVGWGGRGGQFDAPPSCAFSKNALFRVSDSEVEVLIFCYFNIIVSQIGKPRGLFSCSVKRNGKEDTLMFLIIRHMARCFLCLVVTKTIKTKPAQDWYTSSGSKIENIILLHYISVINIVMKFCLIFPFNVYS